MMVSVPFDDWERMRQSLPAMIADRTAELDAVDILEEIPIDDAIPMPIVEPQVIWPLGPSEGTRNARVDSTVQLRAMKPAWVKWVVAGVMGSAGLLLVAAIVRRVTVEDELTVSAPAPATAVYVAPNVAPPVPPKVAEVKWITAVDARIPTVSIDSLRPAPRKHR
jgi:hypothetical protein